MNTFFKKPIPAQLRNALGKKDRACVTFLILSAIIILFFAVLAVLFPYTGDDWAWGSSIGTARLKVFFAGYNGRYFGNLVVMALTRSKVLNVIVMALSYYATCFLCYKYTPVKRNASLVFAFILFFLMPRSTFLQSVAWTSGYANYVPSALLSVAYLVLIRNITGGSLPQYPKYLFAVTFLIGFCGAPFIENIALFNICLGIAVIAYTAIRFRKAYAAHISFLVGALLGGYWMFSNSAYSNLLANGKDGYRTVATGLREIIERCISNGSTICDQLIGKNYAICIVASVLLFLLAFRCLKHSESRKKRVFVGCTVALHALCLFFILCRSEHILPIDAGIVFSIVCSTKAMVLFSAVYALSILAIVLACVEKGRRFRMLLPFYCVPVVVAPLLFVTPIGPRCFFVAHLLMTVFLVDLFGYVTKEMDIRAFNYKALFCALAAVALLQTAVCASIYLPIYRYDSKRNAFARQQSEDGAQQAIISSLPNSHYLWSSSLSSEHTANRYKLFHGLREDLEIVEVTPAEFDAYYETYQR